MLNCTFSILSPPHTEFHKALKGRIPELLRHPAAAHVVDELFSVADAATRNSMVSEFYGREYRVFEGGELNNLRGAPGSLPQLLSRVDGPKAQLVVRELTMCLLPVLEKRLVDSALVHRVTAELLAAAPATTVADAVASLSGEALLHMAHTRDGATAACAVFAYGSARDRKKAVRALKGHVLDMARDEWGHLVLLTCLGVVDDTSLLRKFIVPELQVGVMGWVSGSSVLGACTLVFLVHTSTSPCVQAPWRSVMSLASTGGLTLLMSVDLERGTRGRAVGRSEAYRALIGAVRRRRPIRPRPSCLRTPFASE